MKYFAAIIINLTLVSALWANDEVLNLERCIQIALQNNTTLLNAQSTLEDMRLQTKVARSGFLPSVSASINYDHNESKTVITQSQFDVRSPFFVNREYSAGLSLYQTIWDGGQTIANHKKVSADFQSSQCQLENTRQLLIYSVEEGYLNLLKQKQLLKVYQETLNSSEEALKKAESMEAVGASSRTDVLKARVKAEDDRLNLIKAENAVEVAKANLNYLLGLDVTNPIEVEDLGAPEPLDMEFETAVQIALGNHPALKKADYDQQAAEYTISQAMSGMLPQLTGNYNFGTSSRRFDDLADPFDKQFYWGAGVTLNITLFDGLATPSNIQRAQVGRKAAIDNKEQVRRDVVLEVKAAYLGLEEAKKSIAAATQRVLSAEEDFKLSTARYELGAGTILEQIDAQVALTSAKAQKIQVEYDSRFAQSRLKKAIGKL